MSDDCNLIFYPLNKSVTVKKGTTVLEAVSMAQITINNLCGGDGICGRCKMIVLKGEITGEISKKLTRDEIKSGMVLACMAHVQTDLVVEIPEETLAKDKLRADEDAARFADLRFELPVQDFKVFPLVRKVFLELSPPTLADNTADQQRVTEEIKRKLSLRRIQMGLKVIKNLPEILRRNNYAVTATVGHRWNTSEVMNIEDGDTSEKNYMVIIDIGTTTIVAHVVNVNSLRTVDGKACFNSQGIYGREVTARIIWSEKKGSQELQKLLIDDINSLISNLATKNNIGYKDITAIICAGNTAMSHFLLGLPTSNIRRSPYVPVTVEPPPLRAAEVGIQINPRGLLYSLPGISGWVGSDITAGILYTGMYRKSEMSMLIDIGTNGEIVIGGSEWLVAASASAGPALEGASVSCGMRAEPGAIENVFVSENGIECRTIDERPALGICGSGIIDLLAALLKKKIISRTGKFVLDDERVKTLDNGKQVYFICNDGDSRPYIYISESDIENVITAKAAIYAAMKILLCRLDLTFSDISCFYLGGAFGNHLDVESAVTIGLLPDVPRQKITFVGNTSLKGAKIAALYEEALRKITEIRKMTTYYDLMGADDYVDEFRQALFLPHTHIEEFSSVT